MDVINTLNPISNFNSKFFESIPKFPIRNMKTHVDLCPASSKSWSPTPLAETRQYRELMKLLHKPCERDDCLDILRRMPQLPTNEESFLNYLRSKIEPHSKMWSENKHLWRKNFFVTLPYRQCKKFIEKQIGNVGFFKNLLASLTVSAISHTESWSFKEFWQAALTRNCVCGATNRVSFDENHRRDLQFNCPEVEDTHLPILQGRTKEDARSFIMNASLFRLMKLGTKYRCFREPNYELLYKMGQQFYGLCSSSMPSCGRRKQNV